jgi:hypothetical protein
MIDECGAAHKRNPRDRKSPPSNLVYRVLTPNGTPMWAGLFATLADAVAFCEARSWRVVEKT